jgi:hypothetical protein
MSRNHSKLSENLKVYEVACRCGCGFGDTYGVVDPVLIEAFQWLRDKFGPLNVNSGLRCHKHNKKIGGSKGSQHKLGRALDLRSDSHSPEDIKEFIMENIPNLSTGLYDSFIHIDTRAAYGKQPVHFDKRSK